MSLFNPHTPSKEKAITHHPWEKIVKDIYANKIKYAHNSARNPQYPKKKEKVPNTDRIKFSVIGNRVTKEFIYCVHLVKGMHKYRWKHFDSPTIRGVTGVEWPSVLNELKIQYGGLAYCLSSQVAVLMNDKFLGGDKELKELIESKYNYHLSIDYYNESIAQFANFIKSSGRPCAYMHIAINDEYIGTMIFMLYADIVPYTSDNFLRLCKERKGGYSGTPVHRIVKDGWIQCGGFGLKNTDLDCENFIIPHDKRGVLCMANDGRHVECSTQFFVLLQPAPWMAHKYVAFGQLIDGEATLAKIENEPTWYEAPKSQIIIEQAGILNIDCQDIMINKGANEYIAGHVENLIIIGEMFYELLMENVFLEIEFRRIARLELKGEGAEATEDEATSNIRATQRFLRKKSDIEKQIQKSQVDNRRPSSTASKSQADNRRPSSGVSKSHVDNRRPSSAVSDINNEFDVEVYEYEPEEYSYQQASVTASLVVKPEIPYYIPLTDVPYPGEVDSTYDLKKFLRGDYCLETDLEVNAPKKQTQKHKNSYPSELFQLSSDEQLMSEEELDSDEEKEIKKYLKMNVDRVSFAGGVIRNIAKGPGKFNLFENARKSELITDDELRRLRIASVDYRSTHEKKVSISLPSSEKATHTKIKRRQTGFVRPEDLEKIHIINKSDSGMLREDESLTTARKVRIAPSAMTSQTTPRTARRPTGFVRAIDIDDSDSDTEVEIKRQSVLTRLYDNVHYDDDENGPTLKDYKPPTETHPKNLLLTYSPTLRIRSDESPREKYVRHSLTVENTSMEHVLNLQHGKKIARKISSDYVNTIDQIEQKVENSIRSVEFAKTRPSMSVSQYQMKNQKYHEDQKMSSKMEVKTVMKPPRDLEQGSSDRLGLRLPGDSPLFTDE